ncbi:MAG: OmpA family protein [Acidiferrobacter sp.]
MKNQHSIVARKAFKKHATRATTWGAFGLGALSVVGGPLAVAHNRVDNLGWYAGANIGQSRAKIADGQIASQLQSQGFTGSSISNDSQGTGFKLFGGYQFDRYFALEGGYFNLGDFGYSATTVPAGTSNGSIKLQGVNMDAVGILPITPRFSAFGRLGVTYVDARDNFSGSGADYAPNTTASKHEFNYKYGIGLQYALTHALTMRAEAERYRVKDAIGNSGDADLVSVGLVYHFGGKNGSHSRRRVARADETQTPYVAARPRAHKAAAVVKVITLGDVYFNYNKATLTPKGKAVLDRNIQIMKNNPNDQFRIAGYTSAAGTTAYNQELSEGRARSVSNYLIHHGGIAPDRLTRIGFGDTRPAEYEANPSHLNSSAAKANMRVLFEITVK